MSLCVTVPPEYSSLSSYRATLGHKVKVSTKICGNFHITNFHQANHGARPNAEYGSYSAHPVLGSTMAVWATEDLQPGDEVLSYTSLYTYYLRIYYLYLLSIKVLCNYGYNPWQTVAIPEVETVVVRTGFNWGLFARV